MSLGIGAGESVGVLRVLSRFLSSLNRPGGDDGAVTAPDTSIVSNTISRSNVHTTRCKVVMPIWIRLDEFLCSDS